MYVYIAPSSSSSSFLLAQVDVLRLHAVWPCSSANGSCLRSIPPSPVCRVLFLFRHSSPGCFCPSSQVFLFPLLPTPSPWNTKFTEVKVHLVKPPQLTVYLSHCTSVWKTRHSDTYLSCFRTVELGRLKGKSKVWFWVRNNEEFKIARLNCIFIISFSWAFL